MKNVLFTFFILFTVASLKAQKAALQIGPVASFFGKGQNCLGGEVVANIQVQKILSVGAGFQLLKFNIESNIYAPVFTTVNLSFPTDKIVYFLHIDPGYGIYSNRTSYTTHTTNGDFQLDYKSTGGFYLSTGVGLRFKSKTSPYINLQYSMYGSRFGYKMTNLNDPDDYFSTDAPTPSRGITVTAGIWLNNRK